MPTRGAPENTGQMVEGLTAIIAQATAMRSMLLDEPLPEIRETRGVTLIPLSQPEEPEKFFFDRASGEVVGLDGRVVSRFGPNQACLFRLLVGSPNTTISYHDIDRGVYDYDLEGDNREFAYREMPRIAALYKRLRRSLGEAAPVFADRLEAVRGVGLRWRDPARLQEELKQLSR